jgi:hypothetical protein
MLERRETTTFTDILGAYPEPDPRMVEMQALLQEDLPYRDLDVRHQRESPQLQDIRVRQAEYMHGLLREIPIAMQMNSFLLGSLLVEALEYRRGLHTYLGYSTLEEWCESLHISETMKKEALLLAQIWPFMKHLGYPLSAVFDGTITPVKARHILALHRRRPEQMRDARLRLYRAQSQGQPIEATLGDEESKQLTKAIACLPVQEQQQLYRDVEQHHKKIARRQVEHIRTLTTTDFLTEKEELRGMGVKTYIVLQGSCRNGQFTGTVSFPCGEGEALALVHNRYTLAIRTDDTTTRTVSEFGEELLLQLGL